ncbi:NADP-dependent oxidoreductase domain-containing protein [Stachybotrys elegans]|uniref:NADP-dependent oxidoreductase domain-containing protein n=1 Tax=Stachybotrys elegans TaxID=80388 RepID=A0A8K0WV52_9HYPO|nr:NADP-dependent oxidoreductase domain-containing protein [Stachybotrys elegans]
MSTMDSIKLNDGTTIPSLGYGLGTVHFLSQEKDVSDATLMALQQGYFHLDCAEMYMNEAGVGAGIRAAGIPRDKLFVTTKIVGTKDQDVDAALSSSLSKLGLDYIDLYLVHMPVCAGSPEGLQKIWAQMEAAKTAGKARSIGVSNFEQDDLEIILKTATIPPSINQVEFHPYLQHAELLKFHRQHNIATAAYSALSAITAARPGPVDTAFSELSQKYSVTENDIALRWVLDQGIIVITTSKSAQRLQSYLEHLSKFKLTPDEVQQICELGAQKHYQGPGLGTRLLPTPSPFPLCFTQC